MFRLQGNHCEIHGRTFLNPLTRMGRIVRDVLLPMKCPVCEDFFQHGGEKDGGNISSYVPEGLGSGTGRERFKQALGHLLCPGCLDEYQTIESPICTQCGMMFKSREGEDHICGECITVPKHFHMARAAGIYGSSLMAVIHSFKYKGKLQFARPLSLLLLNRFIDFWNLDEIDVVIPVPLHIRKMRSRGFNQSILLVKPWIKWLKAAGPDRKNIRIDSNNLVRSQWTEPQFGLGKNKRLKNVKNAFKIKDASRFTDRNILLVDDVYTTGATVNECARILLKSGAGRIMVLTLARAV